MVRCMPTQQTAPFSVFVQRPEKGLVYFSSKSKTNESPAEEQTRAKKKKKHCAYRRKIHLCSF